MSRAGWALAGAAVTAVAGCAFVVPIAVSAGSLFGEAREGVKPVACGQEAAVTLVGRQTVKIPDRSAAQVRHATTIIRVGQQMKVPPRGWVIAVATAIQESQLTNLGHLGERNDHDSQGLFQQRPSQGWGTVAQIRDPRYASRSFYTRLVKVRGWQSLPLTVAAQKVQRSAFPDAYAKHEGAASRLVDEVSGGAAKVAVTATTAGRCAADDEVTAGGWVRPVPGGVVSAFRTGARPDHQGVDLAAGKRTKIRAVAAGTVVHVECDTDDTSPYSCDRDGSPSTPGCGWYLDMRHADRVVTRYCHMIVRPLVKEGDRVTAGQQIGWSGTSGNSSGPHLHFEVHLRGDRSSASAVDPVKFMRDRGAPLGGGKA